MTRRLKMKDFLTSWLTKYVKEPEFEKAMLDNLELRKLCDKDEAQKITLNFQDNIGRYAMYLKSKEPEPETIQNRVRSKKAYTHPQ